MGEVELSVSYALAVFTQCLLYSLNSQGQCLSHLKFENDGMGCLNISTYEQHQLIVVAQINITVTTYLSFVQECVLQ